MTIKSLIGACALAAMILPTVTQASTIALINGGKSVVLTGEIEDGDNETLLETLDHLEANSGIKTQRIFLNSDGGNHAPTVALAEQIRALRLDTVVGATDMCSGSCILLFAAGKQKVVFPTSRIAVAQSFDTDEETKEETAVPENTRDVVKTLRKSGAPVSVLRKVATTSIGSPLWLDLRDYRGWGLEMLYPTQNTVVPRNVRSVY